MAEPTDPVCSSGRFEAAFIGRLRRLACWQAGELAGLAEGRHQGPRRKLQDWQIIAGLVAQCLHAGGSLQHLIRRYFAVRLSSSASSQRRQHMHFEPYATVMRHALRPMAQPQLHTGCFFAGLRLVGIDGTQFDLPNTPQINAIVPKARTRRGAAAFGKLSLSVLVELGTHAPLAAAMQLGPMSEKALCQQLWEGLPRHSLMILDRNYGQAPMLAELPAQQVAAMMIARSLLAEERLATAGSSQDEDVRRAGAVRISFSLCEECTVALFMVLQASQGLMDASAQGELVRRVRAQIAAAALPPRRSRSCQRRVRRPVDKWPRMLTPTSLPASTIFTVSLIA